MAKSIADRIDIGMLLLPVSDDDLVKLEPFLATNPRFTTPNIKISVYKNRRGRYKGCYLWADANLGTCRIKPMFATKWDFSVLDIDDIKVIVDDEEPPPWEK